MLRSIYLTLSISLIVTAAQLAAGGEIATPAFRFADVDVANSGLFDQQTQTPLDETKFRAHFLASAEKSQRNDERLHAGSVLMLTFRQPVEIGTALLGTGEAETDGIAVQCLRPEFKGLASSTADADWIDLTASHVFPAGSKVRAIRLTARREHRGPLTWLAWKKRLTNLTPMAVGSGEKGPFGAHPDSIPQGRTWTNTDRDPRPGAPKQIQRGAVSDVLPSWYILSWDAPQAISALWLTSNADEYSIFAYRGESGLNPAIAPATAWRKIEPKVLHEKLRSGGQLHDRLLGFASLQTAALKVQMTSCGRGPVARVARMDAFTDSPAGGLTAPGTQGKEIAFDQPLDGQLAMVITDGEGRLIRNLVAQVDRKRGLVTEHWDLKDEAGNVVPAGKYHWKAIASPQIGLRYQTSVYPNAPQIFSGQTPWLTGESGSNGWLADHSPIMFGAANGDRVYFGSPGVESGVGLIECDLTGRKLWGKHGFRAFSGVGWLAGDGQHLFIQENDALHRMDPETHDIKPIAALTNPERQGHLVGMAAHQGTLAMSWSAAEPWLENATRADVVDLENCMPKFPARVPNPLGSRNVEPMPRVDFLRLLRLTGTPAGQGAAQPGRREAQFPITLDTAGEGKFQYILLAFHQPVPLGSVVLPNIGNEYLVDLAVLKPGAAYPPDPKDDSQWLSAAYKPRAGSWTCVPMPPESRTRGLRIRVRRKEDAAQDNLIDDILAGPTGNGKKKDVSDFDLDKPTKAGNARPAPETSPAGGWFASFEGLKLLRRRFADLTADAEVRVSSGEINAMGEWDAQRTEPLSTDHPGVYVMEWPKAVKLAGLAIKEIDGAITEVDVWDEQVQPAAGDNVPLTNSPGWKHVATYTQSRRDGYHPAFERNDWARYMDGYVSLNGEKTTRAVRLRVTSQWPDSGDRGTATVRHDRGGRELDRRRCRIYGVAALGYLGEEAALNTLAYSRVELRDGATGTVRSEFTVRQSSGEPLSSPSSLAYRTDGQLFGVQSGRVVAIDTESGNSTPVLPEVDGQRHVAHRLAVGPDGTHFVYVLPDKQVRVYDRDGRHLRTIGHAGGQVPGPWDPEKFRQVETLVVDARSQLWVVESQDVPRRIVQYDATGKLLHEFYGNTGYGGGGVLDPADKTRLFYNNVEFAIDWKTGRSRVKNLLAEWLPSDCVPIRYAGRTYLTKAPLSVNSTQHAATVHLYDEERGLAVPVAAFGEADAFDALQQAKVLKLLDSNKTLKDYTFIWCDRDGDAQVDPEEVAFEAKAPGTSRLQLGGFNSQLRCWGGSRVYAPKAVLPNGVPEFEMSVAERSGVYELNNGALLSLGLPADARLQTGDDNDRENHAVDQQGKPLWRYPVSHVGVSGLYLPPWAPGYVTNEFGVVGHAVSSQGDLGEFVVVHANNGMWKIWTADGLLAGTILRHKFDPRSIVDTSRSTVTQGQAFDNLTAGQEHFHGHFAKTADGKYYLVHGHNYIGLWEVLGLDDFRRMSGELEVTPNDLRTVRAQQAELARREAKSQARVLECLRMKPGADIPVASEMNGVKFSIGYDDQSLYVRWNVAAQHGSLRNSGDDFHRFFKTGACLDLQLGVDAAAAADRTAPVAGDLRLLFTVADGKPQAVLYQPVLGRADPKDAWITRTEAAGTTRFDRVVKLANAQLDYKPEQSNQDGPYVFTAAIPLRDINWKPTAGDMLRCDWGLLTSDDGHTVKRREYWSNKLATGTSDEAWEARLEPHLWGTLIVAESSQSDRQLEESLKGKKKPSEAADLLDDILENSRNKKDKK